MPPFRKTSEGLLVTTGSLKFTAAVITLLGSLVVGAIGAVRFLDRTRNAPSREEFVDHVRADSLLHVKQAAHDAFQDSIMTQQARDNHGVVCYVYRNPKPFCDGLPAPRIP